MAPHAVGRSERGDEDGADGNRDEQPDGGGDQRPAVDSETPAPGAERQRTVRRKRRAQRNATPHRRPMSASIREARRSVDATGTRASTKAGAGQSGGTARHLYMERTIEFPEQASTPLEPRQDITVPHYEYNRFSYAVRAARQSTRERTGRMERAAIAASNRAPGARERTPRPRGCLGAASTQMRRNFRLSCSASRRMDPAIRDKSTVRRSG